MVRVGGQDLDRRLVGLSAVAACPNSEVKNFTEWAPSHVPEVKAMLGHILGKIAGTLSSSAGAHLLGGRKGVRSGFFFPGDGGGDVDWCDLKAEDLDWGEGRGGSAAEKSAASDCLRSYQAIVAMLESAASDEEGLAKALEDGCGAVGGEQNKWYKKKMAVRMALGKLGPQKRGGKAPATGDKRPEHTLDLVTVAASGPKKKAGAPKPEGGRDAERWEDGGRFLVAVASSSLTPRSPRMGPKASGKPSPFENPTSRHTRKVYVSGLAPDVTAPDIRDLFTSRYGPSAIYDLYLPLEYGKKTHMGFAFVAMDDAMMDDAVRKGAVHPGFEIKGKRLRIEHAKEKGEKNKPAPGPGPGPIEPGCRWDGPPPPGGCEGPRDGRGGPPPGRRDGRDRRNSWDGRAPPPGGWDGPPRGRDGPPGGWDGPPPDRRGGWDGPPRGPPPPGWRGDRDDFRDVRERDWDRVGSRRDERGRR